jgi:hypothetical protein
MAEACGEALKQHIQLCVERLTDAQCTLLCSFNSLSRHKAIIRTLRLALICIVAMQGLHPGVGDWFCTRAWELAPNTLNAATAALQMLV